jgi:hypothetical protein
MTGRKTPVLACQRKIEKGVCVSDGREGNCYQKGKKHDRTVKILKGKEVNEMATKKKGSKKVAKVAQLKTTKVKEAPKEKSTQPKEKVEKVTRLKAALDVLFKSSSDRMEAKELFRQADEIYAKAHNKASNLAFAEAWAREAMSVANYFGLVKLEDGFFIKTGEPAGIEPSKLS